MKKITPTLLTGALALLIAAPLAAQESPREILRERVLERLDQDGDGQVSAEERQAARERLGERPAPDQPGRSGRFGRFGRQRPGALPHLRPGLREGIRSRLDADGDGQLDPEERASGRELLRERLGERGEQSRPFSPRFRGQPGRRFQPDAAPDAGEGRPGLRRFQPRRPGGAWSPLQGRRGSLEGSAPPAPRVRGGGLAPLRPGIGARPRLAPPGAGRRSF